MTRPARDRLAWIDPELAALDERDLLRQRAVRIGPQAAEISVEGGSYVNFASNDYLGLAADPRLIQAAEQALRSEGWGAGASPLIIGYGRAHRELEERLAEFEGTEAALVFPSGFAANVGTIAALVGRGDAVFSDELNHASLIDGCRLSRAAVHVYRHRDCRHLEELLAAAATARRKLIVSDTLFSMEGDAAPLVELVELAERHSAMLLVDEAHATGVWGARGRGLAEALGVEDRVDVRVGTLSKALGSSGGFVAGKGRLIEWLVNRARPYVFSTAQPPAAAQAAKAALEVVVSEPDRRITLQQRAAWLRGELLRQGWDLGGSASQIVPIVVGEPAAALAMAARLRELGFWVPAIRPPSVPAGRALLRISLCWSHTEEMMRQLAAALAAARRTCWMDAARGSPSGG